MGGAPGELAPLGRLKFRGHMLRILLKPDCLPSYHQVGCWTGSETGCLKHEQSFCQSTRLSALAGLDPVVHGLWAYFHLEPACLPPNTRRLLGGLPMTEAECPSLVGV